MKETEDSVVNRAMPQNFELPGSGNGQTGDLDTDVCIIGAGVAGSCAAHLLRDSGIGVALVEARPRCLPCFKAEKLTPVQSGILGRLGLMDKVRPIASAAHRIETGRRGRFVSTEWMDEYGFHYHDFVNALRVGPDIVVGHVSNIVLSETTQRVWLSDGRSIRARLVVLASGGAVFLHEHLGITRRTVAKAHSMSFGFTIRTVSGEWPFDEVNYLPERFGDRIDYLTLFPVTDGIRANLFTYHDARSPIVRAMLENPGKELARIFSKLPRLIGKYEVVGKVEAIPTDLWVAEPQGRPGLAVIGDAFQRACPATGSGLTKAMNDVDVLKSLVAEWLSTPGMPAAKVDALYANPQKRAIDEESLAKAAYRKRLNTDSGLRMRVHRGKEAVLAYWRRCLQNSLPRKSNRRDAEV